MNFLNNLAANLTQIWSEATSAARVGISLLMAICISAIIAVGYWSSMPTYVTLLNDVGHEKVASVVDALESAGIKYEIGGAGGVLRVDKRDFAKAKNIARVHGIADAGGNEGGLGDMFLSPSDRKLIEVRKKERSLAATIKKFNTVDSADVHLNIPINGPFERKTSNPTASVLITLFPGEKLSDEQALSIASLVAFAVEDLEPENVKITDKNGRVYHVADELQGSINSQIGFVVENERLLARKAQQQLNRLLGYGNSSVQVSLDLTFTNGSKKTVKYDPEGKVVEQEDINTEKFNGNPRNAGGVAGINANLSGGGDAGSSEVKNSTESLKTSYLVPKTEETETNTTPIRNYMTVSVVVNADAEGVKTEDGTLLAGIDKKVADIVKSAVGFKEEKDAISVEFMAFPTAEIDTEVAAPIDWIQINNILQNVSLAVAALASLLFGFLALRKFKPSSDPTISETQPPRPQESRSIDQFRKLAAENPELFSRVLASWVETKSAGKASAPNSNRAA